MSKLTDVKIINHFIFEGKTCGVYQAKFDGTKEIFIENNDTIAVVCHLVGKNADKCLHILRYDIAKELKEKVDEILRVDEVLKRL